MTPTRLITVTIALALVASIGLTGCDDHGHDHGHDHAGHSHDHAGHDHDHAGHDHDHADHGDDHAGHDHADTRSLGAIEIAGHTFNVSFTGDLEPAAQLHIDVNRTAGPQPAAVRVWIGDEAATGVMKAKAPGDGDHFHGHADVPASLQGAKLWIEVEAADGTRNAQFIALPG
jgi:hypothetical protein